MVLVFRIERGLAKVRVFGLTVELLLTLMASGSALSVIELPEIGVLRLLSWCKFQWEAGCHRILPSKTSCPRWLECILS